MVWIQLLGYFIVWTIVLMGVLEVFARCLRHFARLPRLFALLLSLVLYGVVACVFALPLFGLELVQPRAATHSEAVRMAGLIAYLVSLLLAVLFFRRRHLDTLKALGYFQPRSPR